MTTIPDTEEDGDLIPEKGDRIAKVLARAGLCSRRDAEKWILDGRVVLDGVKLTSPAITVGPGSIILVDGKALPDAAPTRLWRYHKPAGLVTSHRDEKGRETMFDKLPPELGRVISVGRLDLNSEGLILLTNDGDLARRLELPSTGWIRRYKVRVHGTVDADRLKLLEKGVTIEGVRYGAIKTELERQKGANAWLTMSLTEGKNREIRRVMDYLGYSVTRLIRLSYGPFQLGLLERGQVEEVPRKVVREQLGAAAPPAIKPARPSRATPASAPAPNKAPVSRDANRRRPAPRS